MTEREIFLAVLDLPDPADRSRYLDKVCGDPAQRARVEFLLLSHDTAGSFLGNPAVQPQEPNGATQDLGVDRSATSENGANAAEDLHFLSPSTRPDSLGRLAHYEILQVLGRGGFGIVFRAFDDILQRVVAIKVMAPQIATLSPARKRFLREARSSAAVRHENVVQVYEVGEQPLPYLAMEFIPGETLQQRLDRIGPVEVSEVLRIGRQIAEGLAAAHASDLIHRDIKPGNILLEGGSQKVKITDFGLARAADDASISQSGVVAGTPMFMSPEQALGHTIDQRADLFSLGSVLYQMASGRPPFRAPSVLAVLKRVAEEPPRPIPEIIPETPDWLCGIITKLHAKNPDDRFQSAREVADLLADCEAKLKAKHEVKNILPAAAKPAGRKWVAAAAALLLLTSVSIAIWMLWPGFTGTLNVEVENDPARVGQSVLVRITKAPAEVRDASDRNWSESSWGGRAFDLKPGRYVVQVAYRDKKLNNATFSEEITISARQVTTVTVPTEFYAPAKKPPDQTGVKDDAVLRDAVLVMNFEKDTFYEKDGKTYVRDLSGNGNDGLCEKVAFTPDGKAGGGLLCQGGRLQLAKSLINRQPNYTTTAWCRFEKPRPAVLTLFLTAMPENVKGPCFGMFIPPEMSFVVNAWNAALPDVWNGASTESGSVPAKDWFFVAVSLTDGGTGKGKLRIVIDDQVHLRQSQMVASRNNDPHVDMFGLDVDDVVIDELTVFQRALSDKEIAAIRARGLKGIPLGVGTLSTLPKTVNEAWVKQVAAMPAEQQVDAVAAKLKDLNPGFDGTVNHKIEDGVVTEFRIVTDNVTNISAIQVFNGLRVLNCNGTATADWRGNGQLADLTPLKGMNLVGLMEVNLEWTKVGDAGLENFKDSKNLTYLGLGATQVSDAGLSYFNGFKNLTHLTLNGTKVSNKGLAYFKDCKSLAVLSLSLSRVDDVGLVHFRDCNNLTHLWLAYTQVTDAGLANFKDCKDLTLLDVRNTKVTAAKIAELKKALPNCKIELDGVDDAWVKQVAAMPAEQQVDAVSAKLKDLNPGFDGKVGHKIEDGVVTELRIVTDKVTNISPIQVFQGLQVLDLSSTLIGANWRGKGELADLASLNRMNLANLRVLALNMTRVGDEGMVIFKDCKDLSWLQLNGTRVTDVGLSHFKDCTSLTWLAVAYTRVSDRGVAHFKNCKDVRVLNLGGTKVTDAGLTVFKDCKALRWLSLTETKVTNAALENFKDCRLLDRLSLSETSVDDIGLSNFMGCTKLTYLDLSGTRVSNAGLAYFKDCKDLSILSLRHTKVTNTGLAYFKECKNLTQLWLDDTRVSDAGLRHFKDCKDLTLLDLRNTKVTAAMVEELKKALPDCKVDCDGVDPAPEKEAPPPANATLEAGFKADHRNRFKFAARASG